ncbi:MAG: YdbH domain-containing protein, partial [Acetobacteraceae bacterium]|nr:YdbH domain-containing protein [Acetobacteraceae bacterium]
RHLVFENVAVGPVGNRDLVARRISVDLGWFGLGPQVTAVRLEGPVLRARLLTTGISFASLDRLIPTTKTVRFPAISTVITDGSVSIVTPFGPMLAKVEAMGRLDRDFRAVVRTAPAALRSATCSGQAGAAQIVVTTASRDFAVSGSGPADRVECAAAKVPKLQWTFHLAAPITMASVSGNVVAQATAGQMGPLRFAGPSLLSLVGTGTPKQFHGNWRVSLVKPVAARESADTIAGDGRFDWRQARGVNIAGTVRAGGLVSGTAQTALSVAGMPELVSGLARRFGAATRSVDVDAQFTAALGKRPQITVSSADIRGAGGSLLRFVGTPGGRWSSDEATINGQIAVAGGGLPSAHIELSSLVLDRDGWTGTAAVIVPPWRSGELAIEVPGINVDLANGFADVSGRAIVSTRFGGAQVDGLDLRLAMRTSLDGDHMTYGPGCADVAATSVRTASLMIEHFAARLCPAAGASAPGLSGKAIAGDFIVGAVGLQGQASGRAFAIDSQPSRISLGGSLDRPVVRSPGLILKLRSNEMAGAAVVAGMVSRQPTGWTGSGHISAAAVDSPAVRIRRGAAQWQLAAGGLTFTGLSAQLTDPAVKQRFAPLQLADADVRMIEGRISGRATIMLVEGKTPIATIRGTYLTGPGTGSAQLNSTLSFSKKLQPLQISELARGFVANVDGKVTSHADLTLDPDGLHGTGTMQFEALSLATAALGPVTGIEGTLHFDDLPKFHTLPSQLLNIASINPGVLVENGVASFQIIGAGAISVEDMHWPFAGGTLTVQPVIVRAGEIRRRYVLIVDGLDAGQFLQRFDLKNLNATGRFDGVLPLVFAGTSGRIEGGLLTARPEGGMIQYVGDVGQESMGAAARLAFDALRSMRYHSLTLALDGDLDGELVTAIGFTGTNLAPVNLGGALPLRSNGLPFKFGITVRAPFRALLGTAASFSDARSLLRNAQPDPAKPPEP